MSNRLNRRNLNINTHMHDCVIPESIHTSGSHGRDFFSDPSPTPLEIPLSFIHFFKFFGLTESQASPEIPIPSLGGVWIFSGTAH